MSDAHDKKNDVTVDSPNENVLDAIEASYSQQVEKIIDAISSQEVLRQVSMMGLVERGTFIPVLF
jgi:hypothetical protein